MVIGGKYTSVRPVVGLVAGLGNPHRRRPDPARQAGLHEEIYMAPEDDPGKEMFSTVITPRVAARLSSTAATRPSPTTSTSHSPDCSAS